MEPMIATTHRETVGKRVAPYWEGASAIHRASRVIDEALSYGTVHVADIFMTSRVYRKTVALGPIVKIARNAGAATRV